MSSYFYLSLFNCTLPLIVKFDKEKGSSLGILKTFLSSFLMSWGEAAMDTHEKNDSMLARKCLTFQIIYVRLRNITHQICYCQDERTGLCSAFPCLSAPQTALTSVPRHRHYSSTLQTSLQQQLDSGAVQTVVGVLPGEASCLADFRQLVPK